MTMPEDQRIKTPPDSAASSQKDEWISLIAISGIVFVEIFDISASPVILASIVSDWDVPERQISGFLVGYSIGLVAVLGAVPWLVARLGCSLSCTAGLALFSLGALACAFAPDSGWLVAARVVQGVGAGISGIAARSAIIHIVDRKRLTRTMGYVAFPAMLGPIGGPPIASLIADGLGWRFYFVAMTALCGCLLVAANIAVGAVGKSPRSFDRRGYLILICMSSIALFLTEFSWQIPTMIVTVFVFLFGILAVGYSAHERKRDNPAVSLSLVRARYFGSWAMGSSLLRISVSGAPLAIILMIERSAEHSLVSSGMLVMLFGIGMAAGRPASGSVEKLLGLRGTLLAAAAGIGGSLSCFALSPASPSFIAHGTILFLTGTVASVAYNGLHAAAYLMAQQKDATDVTIIVAFVQNITSAFVALLIIGALDYLGQADSSMTQLSWLAVPSLLSFIFFYRLGDLSANGD